MVTRLAHQAPRRPLVLVMLALCAPLAVVCWLPSIVELFVFDPNNAHELGLFFAGMIGVTQLIEAIVGVTVVAALMVLTLRKGRPSAAASALCVGVLGLAGLGAAYVTGGRARTHYLVMATATVTFAAAAVMIAVWAYALKPYADRSASTRRDERGGRAPRGAAALLGAATALAAGLSVAAGAIGPNGVHPTNSTNEERVNSDASRVAVMRADSMIRATVFGKPPVEVLGGGYRAAMGDVPGLMLYLQSRGFPVSTPNAWPHSEGEERYDPRRAPEKRVRVQLSDDAPPVISIPWEWPAVKTS